MTETDLYGSYKCKGTHKQKKANEIAIHPAQPEYFSDKELTLKMSILKLLMVVNLCYQLSR